MGSLNNIMNIGFLNTGESDADFIERFGDMPELFTDILGDPEIRFRVFQAHRGEYPENPRELDGFLIPGALASARDDSPDEWIPKLLEYIRAIAAAEVPLVGICFGHQAIARALGGELRVNPRGWEVGITDINRRLENDSPDYLTTIPAPTRLVQSHQDEVLRTPPGAVHLAANEFSEIQAYCIDRNILCFQGHPEFTRDIAAYFLEKNDIGLGEQEKALAMKSLALQNDGPAIGRVLRDFFRER